jgi:hypothetical protein
MVEVRLHESRRWSLEETEAAYDLQQFRRSLNQT